MKKWRGGIIRSDGREMESRKTMMYSTTSAAQKPKNKNNERNSFTGIRRHPPQLSVVIHARRVLVRHHAPHFVHSLEQKPVLLLECSDFVVFLALQALHLGAQIFQL